ncbi:MAG: hypothetical protein ACXWQO_11030 [Bdellovibrionota bacterium]
MIKLTSFLFIAGITAAHAQFTAQEKAGCVEFMGGSKSQPGVMDRVNEVDTQLKGLLKIDSGAIRGKVI